MWHYATDVKVNMRQTIQIYAMLITTTIHMRFSVFIAFIAYAKFTFFLENMNFSLYKI